jgi:UDP-2-acetamido-2,6-beta-L-arabino-hexul-4-ose reductase
MRTLDGSKKHQKVEMIEIPVFPLKRRSDERGYLEEVFKREMMPEGHREFGQCFLTLGKIGKVKGNHWHKRKLELFYLVKGEAQLYFKDRETGETYEIALSDREPKVVLIPPLLLHAIKNTGQEDFYLMVYTDKVSMEFDAEVGDTFYESWIVHDPT